jgi:hypothetical protein
MYAGKPMLLKKGSAKLEILFWICGIVPGIIYTSWRIKTAVQACPKCDKGIMISTKGSLGQRMTGA